MNKKIFLILLVISIVLSLVPSINVLAEQTVNIEHTFDETDLDYIEKKPSAVEGVWVGGAAEKEYYLGSPDENVYGYAMKFRNFVAGTVTQNYPMKYINLPNGGVNSGFLRISFDFYSALDEGTTTTSNNNYLTLYLGSVAGGWSDELNQSLSSAPIFRMSYASGMDYYNTAVYDGKNFSTPYASVIVSKNSWHRVDLEVDITEEKVRYYLDGDLIEGADLPDGNLFSDVKSLAFRSGAVETTFYVDNIKIQNDPEPMKIYATELVTVKNEDVMNISGKVKVSSRNEASIATSEFDVIMASFYENRLVDCHVYPLTVDIKNSTSVNEYLDVNFDDDLYTEGAVFCWDSVNHLVPLSPKSDWVEQYVEFKDITTFFDGSVSSRTILLVDDYPMMSLSDLASVIGGNVSGNTLIKDSTEIEYTKNSRLARYGEGHLMLERSPVYVWGELYVPVSSIMPTLCYHMEYKRFDNLIEITTGTNYPQEAEVIVYAKDFGAVGDGITDDKDAMLNAFHKAISSGIPAKLVLESNKTYLVSERMDEFAFFDMENVHNFTFEGNGSTILFEKPTNSFISMRECSNIKIMNISAKWKEHTSTQGTITEIDYNKGTFVFEVDEGLPLPADDEWETHFNGDAKWGQIYENDIDRMKFGTSDNIGVKSMKHIEGRKYLATVSQTPRLNMAEEGDRYVYASTWRAYDLDGEAKQGSTSAINIFISDDILIEGVNLYGSLWLGASVGLCDGRVTFRDYHMNTSDGRLLTSNSDGIHAWRNRAGLVVENSTFMNNLDDFINTKGEGANIMSKDNETIIIDHDLNLERGDELIFFNPETRNIIARAFVKSFFKVGSNFSITLDRDVPGIVIKTDGIAYNTFLYNANASMKGTVIRNNVFMRSRRHAYISRSGNSIFEGNTILDCGGCGLAAMNELREDSTSNAKVNEGPFPSAFTARFNNISGDGATASYFGMEVKNFKANNDSNMNIDGFLLEGNIISVANPNGAMYLESINDLYMINNTLIDKSTANISAIPITIKNSNIKMIDGIVFDWTKNVDSVIEISDSIVLESDIKNIEIKGSNTAQPYMIN